MCTVMQCNATCYNALSRPVSAPRFSLRTSGAEPPGCPFTAANITPRG